jgi:hypothetical protein
VIGKYCFSSCESLCEVTFESGCQLKELGKSAFFWCGIKSIRIPSSIEVIGEYCFSSCESLCEVTFESGCQLKELGKSAFYESGIKSIRIPSSIEVIGEACFSHCKSLCEVTFESGCQLKELGKSGSKLKEIHTHSFPEGIECIKLPVGFAVEYSWPENCRIDYYDQELAVERKRLNISDYVIDLERGYELIERIGESGEVQLWRKRNSNEEVAVKSYMIRGGVKSKEDIEQRFLREVETLISLSHPCIICLQGYCLPRDGQGPKIVTKYYGNGSLKSILASGNEGPRWWTAGRKIWAILGIVLGMKYIHSKGVIHRDLKPENIFIDDNRRIRIGDFDSSRLVDIGVTMTNTGTPLHMAPEMDTGHYDEKVDIYSFGLIMYEIVTSDSIFSSDGFGKMQLLVKLQSGWRPTIDESVRPFSRRIIERCWSLKSSDRPSFEEIWEEMCQNGFDLIPGGKKSDSASFLSWVENEGGEVSHQSILGIRIIKVIFVQEEEFLIMQFMSLKFTA